MEHEVTPPLTPLGENEIAITKDVASVMGVAVGESIAVVLPNGRHVGLTAATSGDRTLVASI